MAGEGTLSDTYKDLLTTTMRTYLESGKLTDNIFSASPVLDWLRSGDRIKMVSGGERLSVGIMDKKNGTAKSYSGYDPLDITPAEISTRAFFQWKLYSVSVVISGDDLTSNSGDAAVLNLLKERQANAELSLGDKVATGVMTDGTGNGSKDITGLEAMIATTTTSGTYAGINRANNTRWRNKVSASVGAAATALLPAMRTIYNDCSEGRGTMSSQPDFGATTQTVHEALEALIYPMFRLQQTATAVDANIGVGGIRYKNMRIEWDPYIDTSGLFYLLNSKHIWLVVHSARNFVMADEGFQKPVNGDSLISQILAKLQLVTNCDIKLGKMTGIT